MKHQDLDSVLSFTEVKQHLRRKFWLLGNYKVCKHNAIHVILALFEHSVKF